MDVYKLREKMRNVPFGNSIFQNQNFTAGSEGQARRYRHCLLQINAKLNALKECELRRKRIEIDIDELKDITGTKYELARRDIDLEEKMFQLDNEIKYIEDAIIELKTYEYELSLMKEYTREEFEKEENDYWKARLLGDARREMIASGKVSAGLLSSLEQIGIVDVRMIDNDVHYKQITKEKKDDNILLFLPADTDGNTINFTKGNS